MHGARANAGNSTGSAHASRGTSAAASLVECDARPTLAVERFVDNSEAAGAEAPHDLESLGTDELRQTPPPDRIRYRRFHPLRCRKSGRILWLGVTAEFEGTERFQLIRRLGTGASGVVYEAVDRERGAHVAIKTLTRLDAAALYRFKREFRSLADVSHPNLVRLHELFNEKNGWFFSMELIAGHDFLAHVRGDEADPARLRAALAELARGVVGLHAANMLHRDLKPSNVLVTDEGRVVIVDFGIVAEVTSDEGSLRSEMDGLVGTPAYMAPEQGNSDPLTPAADWYAVGVMLYEALTGRLPFLGAPLQVLTDKMRFEPPRPRDVDRTVPEDLSSLCADLLRRNPAARPTGAEVLRRLGVSAGGSVSPSAQSLHTHQTIAQSFVGRGEALERLRGAFDRARAGACVRCYVHGSSGMGKTALVRHFLEAVTTSARPIVLSARCYERESVPYKAFDGVVDELSRYLRSLPRNEVDALLPYDAGVLPRVFPVLARVASIADAPGRARADRDATRMRARAFNALRELFARMADRRPLILFIDDAQWGDVDSAALLAQLTAPPDAPAMQVVITHRSEDREGPIVRAFRQVSGGPTPEDVEDVVVDALSREDTLALARSLLGGEDGGLSATIADESAGNALFLGELVRYVQSSASRASQTGIRLDRVLRERIEDLDDAPARLLEVLAVAARPLSLELARAAAELTADEALRAVTALRLAHFVRSSGPPERRVIEVFHDRVREVLVGMLDAETIREYHARLADALRAAGTVDPEEMFFHLRAGNQTERAAEYAEIAARKAESAFAFDLAASFYRFALDAYGEDHPSAHGLLVAIGSALANIGRGREAAEHFLRATRTATEAERLELHRRAAEQLLQSGHVDEGLDAIQAVLRPLGMRLAPTPLRALIMLLVLRLWLRIALRLGAAERPLRDESSLAATDLTRIDVCWSVGAGLAVVDTIRAAEFQVRNAVLCLRAHEPVRLARALALETIFQSVPGPRGASSAERVLSHLRRLHDRAPSPAIDAYCRFADGAHNYFTGRFRPAAESWQTLKDQFETIREAYWERNSFAFFGLCGRVLLGELLLASQQLPGLLREAEERGNLFLHANLTVGDTNLLWVARDDVDGATRVVDEAMARWSHRGFQTQHWYALQARGHIDLYCDRAPDAFERIQRHFGDLKRTLQLRTFVTRLRARHLRARAAIGAAVARKRPELLAVALEDARALAADRCDASDGIVHAIRAGVARARGNNDESIRELGLAQTSLERAELALYAAANQRALGILLGGDEGKRLRDEATAKFRAQSVVDPERFARIYAPGFD